MRETSAAPSADSGLAVAVDLSALQAMISTGLRRRWEVRDGVGAVIDEACRHAMTPPGKLFRPTMLLVSALAVGGTAESVLPAACATETGHTASLVHDDIIDGDEVRRGRPSVQSKYGINTAIIAGDALIFALFEGLAACAGTGIPQDRVVAAIAAVARAGIDLCRGQCLEAELTALRLMDPVAYVAMVRLKTSALFRAACEAGAILGGGDEQAVAALVSYADHLGIAFQIEDDLLGYTSDEARTGKGAASDVRKGRPTLPVILAHLRADPATRREIGRALSGRFDPAEALAVMTEICESTGVLEEAGRQAAGHAAAALDALQVLPGGRAREQLAEYVALAVNRRG
jgi:geranylgeranyl diphosphate synthase type I